MQQQQSNIILQCIYFRQISQEMLGPMAKVEGHDEMLKSGSCKVHTGKAM